MFNASTGTDCAMQIHAKPTDLPNRRTGILLIHGLCGSPAEMRYVANRLAGQGYRVHCPVLAGHGGEIDELRTTTWQDWLASARESLEELSKECDQIIVGGLSTGALLALMLAHERPEKIHGLALFSTPLWLNGKKIPWKMRLARRLLAFRAIAKHFDFPAPQEYGIKDQRIREFIQNALKAPGAAPAIAKTPAVAALERRCLAQHVMHALKSIRQPALVIHPREDCLADLDNAFYLQRNLSGPVDLVVLEDSYHLVTVDRQRHLVADETARFAGRLFAKLTSQPAVSTPSLA
jgi:carboxylesterase